MKLSRILLRWYKSFHLNYRGVWDKGELDGYRPWNNLLPPGATTDDFPFIEIATERDITTIVGANESGKSHLLNAISKVVQGIGIDDEKFEKTDLCHYAGIRTQNVEAWPNIGLYFELTDKDEELKKLIVAVGEVPELQNLNNSEGFALILAPDEEEAYPAKLFVHPQETPILLNKKQLESVRKILPSVQFIDSKAQLASEVPLGSLLAAYGEEESIGLVDRNAVEKVVQEIRSLTLTQSPPDSNAIQQFEALKSKLENLKSPVPSSVNLEMHLFKEILGINVETLQYLRELDTKNRGYIEGQISKWNEQLNDTLNLAHFWTQDDQFNLSVNYKDGILYFEIKDKTDSIYTFRERSSGLKFFLSYYIQAKAMEMSSRNRNSIVLMDEPDSALSILGQRNLLSVFESLVSPESSGETCQLIYTTHSPYLINRNFPRRIRVVKKGDAEEGTQYIEQARSRRYEPVRTALGIDSAPSLFLGADNVLVEGATDQYLLTELIRVFATPFNVGEFLDLNSLVFVSADSASNVKSVLEQSKWADEPIPPTVVFIDSDDAGDDAVRLITGADSKTAKTIEKDFVRQVGDIIKPFKGNPKIVTIEDIVPRSIYSKAVEVYIKKWLPKTWAEKENDIKQALADNAYGKEGLGASTKSLFNSSQPELKGDYDKMGILQDVVKLVAVGSSSGIDKKDLDQLKTNLILICDFIRDGLEKSRLLTAKLSATQSIKRVIHDFKRLNKSKVQVTALIRLFQRIEREIATVGADGEPLIKVLHSYLDDLRKLRDGGQERVVGEAWSVWEKQIDAIKKNPLESHNRPTKSVKEKPSAPSSVAENNKPQEAIKA